MSSRKKRYSWTIGPILFLIIFYSLFSIYFSSANASLKQRESFIKLLPVIEQKISMSEAILANYELGLSETEAMEFLNSQINQIAQRTNFAINSLTVQKGTAEESVKANIFKVAIKGEGLLTVIMDFFSEIQCPDKLFAVERADIKTVKLIPEPFYSADFVFSYYNLSAHNQKLTEKTDKEKPIELIKRIDGLMKSIIAQQSVITASGEEVHKIYSAGGLLLNGIIWNAQRSLAILNNQVMQINDEIEGFRITEIKKESVTLRDKQGKEEVVYLYE